MKKYIPQILLLMLFSLSFTELMTGNISIATLLNPVVFFLFFFVGYGVPVLLIREVAVRWGSGALSIFLMGLAYGILNEGILAKTLLLNAGVPVSFFDGYASFLGINFPWALMILSWHAVFAVLTPILTIHLLFPEKAREQWLSRKAMLVIASIVGFLSTVFFFFGDTKGIPGAIPQFIVFVFFIGLLVYLASRYRALVSLAKDAPLLSIKPLLLGFFFLVTLFFIPGIESKLGLPGAVLLATIFLLVYSVYRLMRYLEWLSIPHVVMFGMGAYMTQGIFSLVFSGGNPLIFFTVVALEVILVVLVVKIVKKVNPV